MTTPVDRRPMCLTGQETVQKRPAVTRDQSVTSAFMTYEMCGGTKMPVLRRDSAEGGQETYAVTSGGSNSLDTWQLTAGNMRHTIFSPGGKHRAAQGINLNGKSRFGEPDYAIKAMIAEIPVPQPSPESS
jgi:hypothetical protein